MPQAVGALIIAVGVPGLTAGGALTALGSVVAYGATAAIGLGLNMLLAPSQPSGPKPQDVKGVIRASVSPRWRIYGRARRGGAIVYIKTIEGDLYQVVVFCDGAIDGIEAYYLDDREVALDGAGWVTTDPYNGDTARIQTRPGTAIQVAFAPLMAADAAWTSDHVLKRIACALLIQTAVEQEDFSNIYPSRIASLNLVMRGAQIFDPRDDSTAWSANLALCLLDYLKHEDGANISVSLIDQDSFGVAAGICDQVLATRDGGSVRRYHGGVAYSMDEEPRNVVNRFLTAMDGRLFLGANGKIGLLAGRWYAPTVTLTDEQILDFDLDDGAGPFRTANEVIVKYTQVEANYAEATADPWRDEASISERGIKSTTLEVYEVQSHNHARRLAKLAAHRANPRWLGTIRTTLAGLEAFDQRFITVQIADRGIDETFEVGSFALDPKTMTVVLEIQSFSSTAYDFDAALEEGYAPTVPDEDDDDPIPVPASVTLSTQERTVTVVDIDSTPTNIRANVLIVVLPFKPSRGLRAEAEYRDTAGAGWQPIDLNDAQNRGVSGAVELGKTYQARARYVSLGRRSDWTTSSALTVTQS